MDIYIPFTYIIGWSNHKKFYYGAKYAQGCQPSDLWESYFTSSQYVEEFRKENGEPDIIKIHRTFSDADSCVLFEHNYLTKIDAKNNDLFLNKHNGGPGFCTIGLVCCVNKQGKYVHITKEQYHSQTGKHIDWEWATNTSSEGQRRSGNFVRNNHFSGTVPCVNKLGIHKQILKEDYYSQEGMRENWEWISARSTEGKKRSGREKEKTPFNGMVACVNKNGEKKLISKIKFRNQKGDKDKWEWVSTVSNEGKIRLNKDLNSHHGKGLVTCIDKSGKYVQITKEEYHSQTGSKANWEWLHNCSAEGIKRKSSFM